MKSVHSFLLASTALLTVAAMQPQAIAATPERTLIVAQAAPPPAGPDKDKKDDKNKKKPEPPKPAAPKPVPPKPAVPPRPAAPPPPHPATPHPVAPRPAAPPPHVAPPKPMPPAVAPHVVVPPKPQQPMAQPKHEERRPAPMRPGEHQPPQHPAVPNQRPPAPAVQQQPKPNIAPNAQPKPALPPANNAQHKPPFGPHKPAQAPVNNTQQKPTLGPAAPKIPAVAPPPTKPRDTHDFIRRNNQRPSRGIADIRKERHETRQGNRVFIHEGDRTIVREEHRIIIRHNDAGRFAVGARDVRVIHRGDETITIVERPDGVRIISVTDEDGHLIRRVRREPDGRELVIIDNRFAGREPEAFVDLPPPLIHMPRDRYIVDADRATPAEIYDVFEAPPVERIERRYTLGQVRYSAPLRERMPRVDLDTTFDSGSWQLTPDQVAHLAAIAHGLNLAIDRNPREVFLIEGHTDAVGSEEDNLSLSDRRAEAVAVALTEEFHVPSENLVTQGYGEQYLKVPTQGPERANRRVAIRRITPLIDQVRR